MPTRQCSQKHTTHPIPYPRTLHSSKGLAMHVATPSCGCGRNGTGGQPTLHHLGANKRAPALLPVSSLASSSHQARSPTTHTCTKQARFANIPTTTLHLFWHRTQAFIGPDPPCRACTRPTTQSKPWPPRFTDGAAGASLPCSNAPPRAPSPLPPPFPPCPRRRGRPLPPLWP